MLKLKMLAAMRALPLAGTIVSTILEVLTGVGTWITTTIGSLQSLFYTAESGLTLLGTLAVLGVAFGVIFGLIALIRSFLHFRR